MAPYLHTARREAGRPLPSQEGLSGTVIVGLFLAPFPTYMNGSARSANCCSFACFSVDYVQNIKIIFLPIIIISFRKMSKICKSFMWFIGAPQDSSMVYTTHISYLEIYNEMGYDLLDSRHEASRLEDLPSVPIFLFLSCCTCQQLGSYGVYFTFNFMINTHIIKLWSPLTAGLIILLNTCGFSHLSLAHSYCVVKYGDSSV